MIARSEDEFDYFTRLDKLRYEEDRQSYTNFVYPSKEDGKSFNYRLGGDDLVPECIKNPVKILFSFFSPKSNKTIRNTVEEIELGKTLIILTN
jgi:hypothetical protein